MIPILILRGWRSHIENWQKAINLIESKGYKVYSPDLPGFGQNPPPQNSWSIDDYVGWVKDFCEKNNLSQIFLLGHSFGGGVAVKFFSKYPEKISKLVLAGSAIVRGKIVQKNSEKEAVKLVKKFSFLPFYLLVRKFAYKFFFRSDYPLEEGVMKESYLKVINEDLTGYLALINIPVLIVWGDKDKYTPVEDAYLIKERTHGAELEILSGIGHNPHSECSEKFVEIIVNFLNKP